MVENNNPEIRGGSGRGLGIGGPPGGGAGIGGPSPQPQPPPQPSAAAPAAAAPAAPAGQPQNSKTIAAGNDPTYVNLQNTITLIVAGLLGASLIGDFLLNIQFELGIYSGKIEQIESPSNIFISIPNITIFEFNPKRNNRMFSIQHKNNLNQTQAAIDAAQIAAAANSTPEEKENSKIIGEDPAKILIDLNNLMQITNVDEVYSEIKSGKLLFDALNDNNNGNIDSKPDTLTPDTEITDITEQALNAVNGDRDYPTKSSLLAKVIRKVYNDYKKNNSTNPPNPAITGEYIKYKVEALLFFSNGQMKCKINIVETLSPNQIINDAAGAGAAAGAVAGAVAGAGKRDFLNWIKTPPPAAASAAAASAAAASAAAAANYAADAVVPVNVLNDIVSPIQIPNLKINFKDVDPKNQDEILGKMNTSLVSSPAAAVIGGGLFNTNYATYMVHPNMYRNRRRVFRKRGKYTKKRSNRKSRNQRKSRR